MDGREEFYEMSIQAGDARAVLSQLYNIIMRRGEWSVEYQDRFWRLAVLEL